MACTASPSKASTSSIRIANVNSAKFPEETVSYLPGSDEPLLDPKAHSWVNYFKVRDWQSSEWFLLSSEMPLMACSSL